MQSLWRISSRNIFSSLPRSSVVKALRRTEGDELSEASESNPSYEILSNLRCSSVGLLYKRRSRRSESKRKEIKNLTALRARFRTKCSFGRLEAKTHDYFAVFSKRKGITNSVLQFCERQFFPLFFFSTLSKADRTINWCTKSLK